jgi:hypothetical protein
LFYKELKEDIQKKLKEKEFEENKIKEANSKKVLSSETSESKKDEESEKKSESNSIKDSKKDDDDSEDDTDLFESNANFDMEMENFENEYNTKEIKPINQVELLKPEFKPEIRKKSIFSIFKKNTKDSKAEETKEDHMIVKINDRVQVLADDELGTVRYIGKLEGKKTEKKKPDLRTWIGIELDKEGIGKNDGMAFGKRYYQTKPNSSIFVIYEKDSFLKTFKILEENNIEFVSLNNRKIEKEKIEIVVDDKKWKDFTKTEQGKKWKRIKTKNGKIYFGNTITNKPQWTVPEEFIEFDKKEDYEGIIEVGNQVQNFMTQNIGVIRYLGKLENSSGENKNKNWVGIEWDIEGNGKNDGEAFGKRYYQTKPNSSSFVVFDPNIFLDNFCILDENEDNRQEIYLKENYDENAWKEFKKTDAGTKNK